MKAVAMLSCDLEPTHRECGSNHATTKSRWPKDKKRKCLNVAKLQDLISDLVSSLISLVQIDLVPKAP